MPVLMSVRRDAWLCKFLGIDCHLEESFMTDINHSPVSCHEYFFVSYNLLLSVIPQVEDCFSTSSQYWINCVLLLEDVSFFLTVPLVIFWSICMTEWRDDSFFTTITILVVVRKGEMRGKGNQGIRNPNTSHVLHEIRNSILVSVRPDHHHPSSVLSCRLVSSIGFFISECTRMYTGDLSSWERKKITYIKEKERQVSKEKGEKEGHQQ